MLSCKGRERQHETTQIISGKWKAVGKINDDSMFIGKVKFYDLQSGLLDYTCEYSEGNLRGEKVDFYPNGHVAQRANYLCGKLYGNIEVYNSSGQIETKTFSYMNLATGPVINYKKGEPSSYDFYSLDQRIILHLNYDSIKGKSIDKLVKNFFFYNYNHFETFGLKKDSGIDYFVYTPNPPHYSFQYDFVTLKDDYIVDKILEVDKTESNWITFSIRENAQLHYAIRLKIIDSINGDKLTMYKKIGF
jgi:hypothetical protein